MFGLKPRGRINLGIYIGTILIVGLIVGFVLGMGNAMVDDGLWPQVRPYILPVTIALAVVMAVFSVWIGARWMNSIDEAAQEAHKWSWYWGGSAGMAVGMVFLLLGMTSLSKNIEFASAFGGRTDPAAYAATGAMWLLLLMTLGYVIAWGIWWFRRR